MSQTMIMRAPERASNTIQTQTFMMIYGVLDVFYGPLGFCTSL